MRLGYGLALAAGMLTMTAHASAMGDANHSPNTGPAQHAKKVNAPGSNSILGKVDSIKGDTLVLKSRDNREHDLTLGKDTRFTHDGKKASRNDIHPGDEVRAAFERSGNEMHASRITIESKSKSSAHRSTRTTEQHQK